MTCRLAERFIVEQTPLTKGLNVQKLIQVLAEIYVGDM